jgi:hypothetical protein
MNVRSTVSDAKRQLQSMHCVLKVQTDLDATNLMDLMPDVAVTMATMGTNHLWMNLCKKTQLPKWRHPEVKAALRTVIVMVRCEFPGMPLMRSIS